VLDADGEGTPQEHLLTSHDPIVWTPYRADTLAQTAQTGVTALATGSRPFILALATGASWTLTSDFERTTTTASVTSTSAWSELADADRNVVVFDVTDKADRPVTCRVFFRPAIGPAYTQVGIAPSTGTGARQPVQVNFTAAGDPLTISQPGVYLAQVISGAAGGGPGTYIWHGAYLE
jgi:hypothetical protein